jgi:hypothetical protein
MPPKVLDPAANGYTTTASYYFIPTNAHGIHPATTVSRWKVTVTTGQDGTGTLITQTGWSTGPIGTCQVTNLPANNSYPYTQIVYEKPPAAGGGTFTSFSNQFQSRP